MINVQNKKMLSLTVKDWNHIKSKKRYICNDKFDYKDRKYEKVKDHFHFTETYRGAAHSIFNLRYSVPREIPIVIHNGSIYEIHLIIKNSRKV